MKRITLRTTDKADLDMLFEFQKDAEANRLAAFTAEDPTDKAAYLAKYEPFLSDPTINNQTILLDGVIVGSVAKFERSGEAEITYWIDRKVWGQGIATDAVRTFLSTETKRPIVGRVAFDNFASQRVLERCGFIRIGADRGYSNARQCEVEEYIYQLS